jgi:hypothetical protein
MMTVKASYGSFIEVLCNETPKQTGRPALMRRKDEPAKIPSKKPKYGNPQMAIRFDGHILHDNIENRPNLYFIFGAALLLKVSNFYSIIRQLTFLTTDILEAYKEIASKFKDGKGLPYHVTYAIYALYDICVTIIDFFLSFYETSSNVQGQKDDFSYASPNDMLKGVMEIKNRYAQKKHDIEKQYSDSIDKLDYEEENEILKLTYPQIEPNSFDSFMAVKNLYKWLENTDIDNSVKTVEPLLKNLSDIESAIQNYGYMIQIIESNTPSVSNLVLAQLIYHFPYFLPFYQRMVESGFIQKNGHNLIRNRKNLPKSVLSKFFVYLYEWHRNMTQDVNKMKEKEYIPWAVIEYAFGEKGYKDSYASAAEGVVGKYKTLLDTLGLEPSPPTK